MARFPVAPQAFNESNQPKGTGGGGGGSSTLAGLTDVALAGPADTQVLTYVAAAGKWENKPAPSGSGGAPTLAQIASAMPYVVDLPENHGAVRNGTTDDTAAIKAAISAAVAAGIANGTYYAEVWFSAGTYLVSGAVDTTQNGRAQIPLPYRTAQSSTTTTPKFVLVLKGVADGSAFPLWYQSVAQKAGAVLLTNLSAGYSGTFGSASVVGGPTLEGMANAGIATGNRTNCFSNMLVVIDGLTVVSNYTNPLHVAVDLQCIAQANVKTLGVSGNIIPSTWAGSYPNAGGVGLRMPQAGNNDYSMVGSYGVEGYTMGLIMGEHVDAERVATIYCQYGVCLGITPDSCRINYWSSEICQYHLDTSQLGGASTSQQSRIDIGTWDIEDAGTIYHVNDTLNALYGTCSNFKRNEYSSAAMSGLVANGGVNFKVIKTGGSITGSAYGHPSYLNGVLGQLGTALTTGGPITSMQLNQGPGTGLMASSGIASAVPAGTFVITDPSGAHTQTFTTGGASIGATSIIVTSQTPNFAYPVGSLIGVGMPNNNVAFQNPYWRDAAVTITGGTVTAIAVDGAFTGLSSTGQTVIVPSGKNIVITYSVAPSWNWVLM